MSKSLQFVVAAVLICVGFVLTHAWGQEPNDTLPTLKAKTPAEPPSFDEPHPVGAIPAPDFRRQPEDSVPASPIDDQQAPAARRGRLRGVRPMGDFAPGVHPGDPASFFGGPMRSGGPAQFAEMDALHQAVDKLRSAKEGPEKEAAKKEVSRLLDQSFTHDLERREQEVSEIESRVKKLRDQIDKRKKAKDEIVNLRLKTIVNETEGLGFPGQVGFEHQPQPRSGLGGFGPSLAPPRAVDPTAPSDAFTPRPSPAGPSSAAPSLDGPGFERPNT